MRHLLAIFGVMFTLQVDGKDLTDRSKYNQEQLACLDNVLAKYSLFGICSPDDQNLRATRAPIPREGIVPFVNVVAIHRFESENEMKTKITVAESNGLFECEQEIVAVDVGGIPNGVCYANESARITFDNRWD